MFYKSGTIYEMLELKDPSQLFQLLIQPNIRNDYPDWSDIWQGFQYFKNHHESRYKKSYMESRFISLKHFSELESFGIDYNHRDGRGNNFLQYMYNEMASGEGYGSDSKLPVFREESISYVTSKTKDVLAPNAYNRNILFSLTSIRTGGIYGENFFEFLKKYPTADIHLVDTNGTNLLFDAILHNAPRHIINYLIDNNVSLTQVNKDNRNLLHMFMSWGKNKENLELFNKIFESVDDISLKPKFGGDFLETFIGIVASDDTSKHTSDQYRYWLKVALTKIIKGEFKKNLDILENTIKTLEKNRSLYEDNSSPEDASHYRKAMAALNYFKLEMTMPSEEGSIVKKVKI